MSFLKELGTDLIVDAAMHDSVAAIAACGVSPLVRITGNEGWMVKRMYYLPEIGSHVVYQI